MSNLNADGHVSIMSIMYSQIHRLSTKIRRMKRRNADGYFCPLLKNSEENQEEQRLVKFYYFAFLLKI
ncbi:hypothetical protein DI291_20605 [Bacillus paralicheniformis]|nr:hypothetical protein DI291_20605 [Bacillus paralicheniformis]